MHDDAVPLLIGSGQKSGHVFEHQQRNIERVAKAHKPRPLSRRVNVQDPGQVGGLVGDDSDRTARKARKAYHHVAGEVLVHLVKAPGVHHLADDVVNVVGLLGALGHHRVQLWASLVALGVRQVRNPIHIVLRQVAQERLKPFNRSHPVRVGKVGYAALAGVRGGSAQLFRGHLFVRHRLDHVGTRHKHVRIALHHSDEVGERRRIHGSARTGAHNQAQLRNHPRRERVAVKQVGVAA